jgi:hypothetical protein
MRIVFITCDDVFYLPRFFSRVLDDWAAETAALVILPPLRDLKTTVRRSYDLYGPWGFFKNSARYAARKAAGRLAGWVPACRTLSVEGVARSRGIPILRPASVNAPDFVAHVRLAIVAQREGFEQFPALIPNIHLDRVRLALHDPEHLHAAVRRR